MEKFLGKFPNWLRWILFIPIALIAFTLAYPIIKIGNLILGVGSFQGIIGQILLSAMAGGWSGIFFVWVGAKVAPKSRQIVSVVLAVIIALMSGMSLMAKIILNELSSVSWIELIPSLIAGLSGAIAVCYSFYKGEEDSIFNG